MSVSSPSAAINFEHLLQQLDTQCASLPPSVFEKFSFRLDEMAVDIRRIKHASGDKFVISCAIGFLPFSIESPERRQAIRDIVASAKSLPTAHFAIDIAGKITAGCFFDSAPITMPDFIFYPLSLFLQEAQPFMRLIGAYLQDSLAAKNAKPPHVLETLLTNAAL